MRMHVYALIVITTMLATGPRDLQAQDSRPERQITLIEAAGTPAPVMVHRRVAGEDRDVITLTKDASPRDLHAAIRLLDVLHTRFGDSLSSDIVVAGRFLEDSTAKVPPGLDDRHSALLRQLRSSARANVRGFGEVRVLRIAQPVRNLTVSRR